MYTLPGMRSRLLQALLVQAAPSPSVQHRIERMLVVDDVHHRKAGRGAFLCNRVHHKRIGMIRGIQTAVRTCSRVYALFPRLSLSLSLYLSLSYSLTRNMHNLLTPLKLKGEIVVLDCFFGLCGHFEGILGDDIF
jgi:hypothetical protein